MKPAEYGYEIIEESKARVVSTKYVDEVSLGFMQASFDPVLYMQSDIIVPKMEIPNQRMASRWVDWNNMMEAVRRNDGWSREQVEFMFDNIKQTLPLLRSSAEGLRIIPMKGMNQIDGRYTLGTVELAGAEAIVDEASGLRQFSDSEVNLLEAGKEGFDFAGDKLNGIIARCGVSNLYPAPVLGFLLGTLNECLLQARMGSDILDDFRDIIGQRVKSFDGEMIDLLSQEGRELLALSRFDDVSASISNKINRHIYSGEESELVHQWEGIEMDSLDRGEGIDFAALWHFTPQAMGSIALMIRTLRAELKEILNIPSRSYTFYESAPTGQMGFLSWCRELERVMRILEMTDFIAKELLSMWNFRNGAAGQGVIIEAANGRWRQVGKLLNMPIYHGETVGRINGDTICLNTTYPVQVGEPREPGDHNNFLPRTAFAPDDMITKRHEHHQKRIEDLADIDNDEGLMLRTTKDPKQICIWSTYIWPIMPDDIVDKLLHEIERSTASQAVRIDMYIPRGWGDTEAELLAVNDATIRPRLQMFDLYHHMCFNFAPNAVEGRHTLGDILISQELLDRWGYTKDERPVPTKVGYPYAVV